MRCSMRWQILPSGAMRPGILDMEFVEKVEVYENFIKPEELSDMEAAVVEVTKQKESIKYM